MKFIRLFIVLYVFPLFLSKCFGQQDLYIAESANFHLNNGAKVAVFGNIINDAQGGLNSSFGSSFYLYRHPGNGLGRSRIYSSSTVSSLTAFVAFWDFYTDNTTGLSRSGAKYVGVDSGFGAIQIEQLVRIQGTHYFVNGIVWTPRSKFQDAYIQYYKDSAKYFNARNNAHIDGYASYSGCTNFILPIGDGNYLRKAGFLNPVCGNYKAAYYHLNPQNENYVIFGKQIKNDSAKYCKDGIIKVSSSEFWHMQGNASTEIQLESLNSIAGYSNFDSTNNFNSKLPSNIVITGFDGQWENLKLTSSLHSFIQDTLVQSKKSIIPDSGYNVFTFALQDTLSTFIPQINQLKAKTIVEKLHLSNDLLFFNLRSNEEVSNIVILLYNVSGICLFQKKIPQLSGLNEVSIPMFGYAQGIYFLKVYEDKNEIISQQKIIKY